MQDSLLNEPVLVGRESELVELTDSLREVVEGKGRTVFVTGEAGTGKTRLVREFMKIAKEKNVSILYGWCLSNAAEPYFPFIQAFKSYFAEADNEHKKNEGIEVNAWLTGLNQVETSYAHKSLSPQSWKDLTFEVVSKTLLSLSSEKPTILFIEDIHWGDSASFGLLHYISRILGSARLLVLATFRNEELTTDAEGRSHPLAEELRLMRAERLVKEIKLSNLNQNCVTEIAANLIGGKVSAELGAKLSEESQGNALFVVESIRMLLERKILFFEDNQWCLTVDGLGLPNRFKDIVLRRLANLKFNERRVLDAASVIGDIFDVDLLSAVLGQDNIEALENLSTIAKLTSLLAVEGGFFKFNHAKTRLAIYEEIALPLRRGYHKRVAEKLKTRFENGRLPLGEIAYHYAEAGARSEAVKYAFDAGQDELEKFSNAEAAKHFAYVVESLSDNPEEAEIQASALEKLGDAYFASCTFKAALNVYERVASTGTAATRLRAYRKAMDAAIFGIINFPNRVIELAAKAEPYATSDSLESARICFMSAIARTRTSIVDYDVALKVFEEESSIPDIARILIPRGNVLVRLHRYREGISSILLAAALYEEMNDWRGLLDANFYLGLAFVYTGALLNEALDKFNRAIQIGEKVGNYDKIAQARFLSGRIVEYFGRIEEAVAQNLKARECYLLTDIAYSRGIYPSLAIEYAKLGDLQQAEKYSEKYFSGLAKIPDHTLRSPLFREHEGKKSRVNIEQVQAVLCTANGKWNEADQHFEKCIELAQELNAWYEIGARSDYAWALQNEGRTEEAKMQLEKADKLRCMAEEEFVHVAVEANLTVPRLVTAGQEFEIRLDLVNVSKKQGLLVKAENLIPPEFAVTMHPTKGILLTGSVEFNRENLNPFQVLPVKLKLKALEKGIYLLNPQVLYIDDLGETKTCKIESKTVTVRPPRLGYEVLPDRVSTGYSELDGLLFGGIPQGYAVVLSSTAGGERELLVTRFLEAGVAAEEATFYITVDAGSTKTFATKYPSDFYLFLCNPQADSMIQSLNNVSKLKGVENLTDIDIAFTKAFRSIDTSTTGPRRICFDIVSDVLLQHHAVTTRRWLSALLPTLKSKGFTVLATVNPRMHPPEEFEAILGLFEGEISIYEKETPKGTTKFLRIKRMTGQKYLKDEIPLTEE